MCVLVVDQQNCRSTEQLFSFFAFSYLFTVYKEIDNCIEALNSKQIDGMLLDHYTASYYQARDKLKSLIIVAKFELRRDVGLLFSNDRKELVACLRFHRSNIWRLTQTITSSYKVSMKSQILLC